jgi:hypothetical protein
MREPTTEHASGHVSSQGPGLGQCSGMSPERSAPYAVGWGSFVGHVMRETGGESDPKVVNKLLCDELSA